MIVVVRDDNNYLCCVVVVVEGPVPLPSGRNGGWVEGGSSGTYKDQYRKGMLE